MKREKFNPKTVTVDLSSSLNGPMKEPTEVRDEWIKYGKPKKVKARGEDK